MDAGNIKVKEETQFQATRALQQYLRHLNCVACSNGPLKGAQPLTSCQGLVQAWEIPDEQGREDAVSDR